MNEMNALFDELWWYSDQSEIMNKFVDAIKLNVHNLKGDVKVAVIDLYDFGFEKNHIYIVFDDCSGCNNHTIFDGGKFIKYYKEIVNYNPELCPQDFWVPKLKEILDLQY